MSDTYQRLKKKMGDTYSPDDLVAAIEFRRNAYELNKEQMSTLLGISIFEYNQFLYGTFVLPLEARRRAGVVGVPLSVLLAQPVAVEKPEPELIYQVRNPDVGGWRDVHREIYATVMPSDRRVMLMEVPEADVADYENAIGSDYGKSLWEKNPPVAGKHWPPESVPGEATFHKKVVALGVTSRMQGYIMGAYRESLTERGIVFPCVDDKDNKRLTPGTREHAEWLADKIVNEGFFNEQAAELLRKWPEYEEVGRITDGGTTFFVRSNAKTDARGKIVYVKKA